MKSDIWLDENYDGYNMV